jgi:hypothetical protein
MKTLIVSPDNGMAYARFDSRKPSPKILLALTAAAALSFAHPASANLITNPGFEDGFNGWTATGSGIVVGTFFGTSPHSGSSQAAFTLPGGSLSQSVATTPGASYTINFFLALAGVNPVSTSVSFGGVSLLNTIFAPSFGYTEFTFNVTASTASTDLSFLYTFVSGRTVIFLDDVSVTPVGVPDAGSTLRLLGCALHGLVALRRKLSC